MVEINTGLTALGFAPSDRARSSDGGSRVGPAGNDTSTESTSSQVEEVQTENAVPAAGAATEAESRNQGNGINDTRSRIDKDTATGLFVYQSLDLETEEVVRQFPAEEILNFLGFYQELESERTEEESKVDTQA